MGICLIIKSGGGTDTSNATATADKILSGYTIYSNDDKVTGSMFNVANQANIDLTDPNGYHWLTPGTVIHAWNGWHDGTCELIAQSLESQTQCDIPNQWWCLTGYSYWANGSKYDGAMINRGAKTWTLGANAEQKIEDGWHDGNGYVNQSIPVDTGEWGPNPTTTNQQLCWQGWYYSKNRWCWGNGNLTSGNIKSGVSIFGVSGSWSGWVDSTIQWNAIGATTAVCNLADYEVYYTRVTPSQSLFNLRFGYDVYSKLISLGMSYINWNAITNSYKSANRYEAPLISGDCYCDFSNSSNRGLGRVDYPSGNQGKNSYVTITAIKMYTTSYTGSYGADMTTSGKYDIKKGYDWFTSLRAAKCEFVFVIGIGTWDAGDGFGGTCGRSWFKSFNCWFSKS